jgi:hypothetical protein
MDTATIIVIVIGCVNLGALIVVAWQTWLTRRSVKLSQQNLQIAQSVAEIDDLPESGSIIWVQTFLQRWVEELDEIIKDEAQIRNAILSGKRGIGKKYGLDTPKGIVMKPIYDGLHKWLQIIVMAAAQYYYYGKSCAHQLSGESLSEYKSDFILRLLPDVIKNCEFACTEIKKMQALIKNKVPQWYLNSPARIQDSEFFDR